MRISYQHKPSNRSAVSDMAGRQAACKSGFGQSLELCCQLASCLTDAISEKEDSVARDTGYRLVAMMSNSSGTRSRMVPMVFGLNTIQSFFMAQSPSV